MKILIDIGHPGHVHYFKNIIKALQKKNHEIIIIARDRAFVKELLNSLNLPFYNRGKGKNSIFGKLFYMLWADLFTIKIALKHKPDLYLSFSIPYPSHIAYLLGKPNVVLTDTEHEDKVLSKFTYPFAQSILTPESYYNNLGDKQIRFNGTMEYFYLNRKYFRPDNLIRNKLNIKEFEEYVIIRFVSWNAHHDIGQFGLDLHMKRKLILLLEKKYKIFISSESDLPEEFKKYQINIEPEKMHDVLAFASLFIGESATMASESVILGTHAVYVNSLPLMGYLQLEKTAGLLSHFSDTNGLINQIEELINDPNLKKNSLIKKEILISSFIDPTAFLVWFMENFPESKKIMKESPDFQYNFK